MPNNNFMPRGNLLSTFMQFRQNPLALLTQRFKIPEGMNDPNQILDQMCNDKIDAKNEKIADLERQLSMAQLSASQQAQNAFIAQGFANEVNDLYNRLADCPVPSTPVYGRTPIFTPTAQTTPAT